MDGGPNERPETATVLERWRTQLRLSKQRLADQAGVSATYVRLIESGTDDDGRPVIPSAGVIQKLARGLGRSADDDATRTAIERDAYAELMAAAGYFAPLPPGSGDLPAPMHPQIRLGAPPGVREAARQYEVAASAVFEPNDVAIDRSAPTDDRLRERLVPLVDGWDRLDARDQDLLLGIIDLFINRLPSRRETD